MVWRWQVWRLSGKMNVLVSTKQKANGECLKSLNSQHPSIHFLKAAPPQPPKRTTNWDLSGQMPETMGNISFRPV